MSQSGRPVSGFVRPGTQSGRPGTMEQAIRTPRTAQTARYGILYIEQKLGKLKCKSQLKAFGQKPQFVAFSGVSYKCSKLSDFWHTASIWRNVFLEYFSFVYTRFSNDNI